MSIFIKKDGILQHVDESRVIEVEKPLELNVIYGNETPSDTSKLWVKTTQPNKVIFNPNYYGGNESLQINIKSLSTGIYGITTATVGNKIYLFGGYTNNGYPNSIQVYDSETNTLQTLDTVLLNTGFLKACTVGNKIYLFGSNIQIFDTTNYSIQSLSIYVHGCDSVAAVGTKIYSFGGYSGKSTSIDSGYYNDIQVFDTVNNTLSTLSATLHDRASKIGAIAVGTKIYLFGGYARWFRDHTNYATIQIFDTLTSTVQLLDTNLLSGGYDFGISSVGNKIYLFGQHYTTQSGTTLYNSFYNRIQVFDIINNTIQRLDIQLPSGTANIGTSAVGTKIYLFGGQTSNDSLSTINQFTVAIPLIKNNLLLTTSSTSKEISLVTTSSFDLIENIGDAYIGNNNNEAEQVKIALYQDNEWININ